MSGWRVWLGIAAIFLSGVVVGALGTGYVVRGTLYKVVRGEPGFNERLVMGKLRRELGLNRGQEASIRPIVEATFRKIYALRAEERPKIDAILDQGIKQLRPLLSPEQNARLDALFRASQVARGLPGTEGLPEARGR